MGVVIAKKVYEKPEEGSYLAVLADVVDLGMQETNYGMKDRLALVWVLDALNSDGYNFQLRQKFTKSLHENAQLTKTLKQITGAVPNEATFDTEPLIGLTRIVHVTHNANAKGEVFANIELIQRTKDVIEVPENFVREQDKEPKQPQRRNAPTPAKSEVPAPAKKPVTRTVANTAPTRTVAAATAQKPRAVAPAEPVEPEVEDSPIDEDSIPF
jgi:hypothetical protein